MDEEISGKRGAICFPSIPVCHDRLAWCTLMTDIPESLLDQLKSCRALPSVPAVAFKVLDLCEQDNIHLSQVARTIAGDPALAAKVLKVSNSALYGVRSPVTTLDHAIAILGINATLSLSLGFSLVGILRKSKGVGFDHLTYWRRAVITAAAAKALGAYRNCDLRDEFFIVGLLQDIGVLVFNEVMPERYGPVFSAAEHSHQKLVELERETFGVDHAVIGGWLLERWNLPEKLRFPVAASHSHELIAEPEIADFCRAIIVAGHIAEIWNNPQTAAATAFAQREAQHLLQMSSNRFEQLLGEVAELLPEITSILELDIGGEEAVSQMLDQAREALVVLNLQTQQQFKMVQDRARRDGLIAVYNRSYLEDVLPKYFDFARRSNQPLSAIFADIDFFKKINDTHGHMAGDSLLKSVAKMITSVLRASDLVARYGGDEIVCLLPNTGDNEVIMVAERIRKTIAHSSQQVSDNVEISITISLGCATFSSSRPFESGPGLLKEADRCLYAAKRSGRNKVVASNMLPADWEAPVSERSLPTESGPQNLCLQMQSPTSSN